MARKVHIIMPKKSLDEQDFPVIRALYDDKKEFRMDSKGYFLIRVDKKRKMLEVALCKKLNQIAVKVEGKTPIEVYQTVIREKLVSRLDHAAYLGRELERAFICIKTNKKYVQDDEY